MISIEEYKKRHVTVVVEEQHGLETVAGPRGERGEKGEQGEPGVSNIPGPQGERGEQGQQGEQGPAGQDGKDGKDGVDGKDGLPGVNGKDGQPGLPGRDGVDGKNGIDGQAGAQGIQGIQGETGPAGAVGPAGPQGVAGAAGIQGVPGVGIKGIAAGYVDAGTFVTLDNIKATVTTTGNRGLSVATVSGTFQAMISSNYALAGGASGNATAGNGIPTYNTTPSGSWFGYHFGNAGDGSTYLVNDITNQRFYRIHLMIGPGYTKNFISIERLA